MKAPLPTPDLAQVARFLTRLDAGGAFSFQTFDDDERRKSRGLVRVLHGQLGPHARRLKELNQAGAGCFVTVNETDLNGRSAANVVRVRAVFADLDGSPLEPVKECALQPHSITETSAGRWHAFWLVDELPLENFEGVQRAIAARFNGDRSVHDLPRVMRLPGFVHRKVRKDGATKGPFLSRIIELSDAAPYSVEQILTEFPPIEDETAKAGTSAPAVAPLGLSLSAIRETLSWLDPDDYTGYDDGLQVGQALHHELSGDPAGMGLWAEWSAAMWNYNARELQDKWKSFGSYSGVPITMRSIVKTANEARREAEAANDFTTLNGETQAQVIARLSALAPLDYERVRESEAEKLGVRVSVLDKEVGGARKADEDDTLAGRRVSLYEPEPWPEPVDGAAVLDEAYQAIRRHMAIRDEHAAVAALWAAHTHLYDIFSHTPRLGVTAPDAECGKTILMVHLVGALVPRPRSVELMKPAPFFRLIELFHPVFLIDETDTFIREDSDLLTAINAGWEPHGTVPRCVGENLEPREFSTWTPVAIGGIRIHEFLPAATLSRTLVIALERAAPRRVRLRLNTMRVIIAPRCWK